MIYLNIRASRFELNRAKWSKAVEAHIEEVFYGAAYAFINAAGERIPVLTGTAKGALKAKVQSFKGTVTPMSTYIGATVIICPKEKRTGRGPDKGAKRSRYIFERQRDGKNFTFKFKTNVLHLILRDTNIFKVGPTSQKPTPWYAIRAGTEAFQIYLKDNIVRGIPTLESYLTTYRTTVEQQRIVRKVTHA